MIAASRRLGVLALALAVAVHAALGWALMAEQEVAIESGAGAQEVRVGTSFADMAAGTLEAIETTDLSEAIEPEALNSMQPDSVEPVETPLAVSELAADAVATIAASEVPEVVEALDQPGAAVSRSLRPQRRSEAFEKKNEQVVEKAAPAPAKKRREPAKQPRGNAEQNQQAGAANGNSQATATASGAARGSAAASGNAAVSNYPGLVMKRVSRVPRRKAGSRGTAVVAFSISANGGLASASIARSSGSAALDRAALRMIQSAAPFPPPPPGAQRSFSINVEGR